MRKPLLLALCFVLIHQAAAFAVPSPLTSTCVLGGQPLACQYRFRADGLLDVMTVTLTLLDAAGAPEVGWPTSCVLVPNAGTLSFCSCCPNPQFGFSGPGGVSVFTWSQIGGRGTLDVSVGAVPLAFLLPITFTSPDLSGSCELLPMTATNIIDLGIWAGAFPPNPFKMASDYNCDGLITVLDLGVFAGGLTKGCGLPCP